METKNIYQKLLLCQQEIGAITKTQDNPFFHSKYADINAILAVVKPILNSHGLVLTQALRATDGKNGLLTAISDADSKDEITAYCYLPEMPDPQKTGSAITYFRRYALQSILALEVQDDDGNVASNKEKGYTYPPSYVPKKNSKLENDFMGDLEPTAEEIITWQEKLESARDIKELQAFWKLVPPMAKDKLEKLKNELKYNLNGKLI